VQELAISFKKEVFTFLWLSECSCLNSFMGSVFFAIVRGHKPETLLCPPGGSSMVDKSLRSLITASY